MRRRLPPTCARHKLPNQRGRLQNLHRVTPSSDHPWPTEVKSAAIDRFNSKDPITELILVQPIVIEVSADTAFSGISFRHPLRYLRARPELNVDDVVVPEFLQR